MRPKITLDTAILAANAQRWRDWCAPARLYAVVKADGYGWGLERVVPALEPHADAFCVADTEELRALRRYTDKAAIVIGGAPLEELPYIYASGAMASIDSEAELDALQGYPTVRVGIAMAAGWSGLFGERIATFAAALAARRVSVSLWTHFTDMAALHDQAGAFLEAKRTFENAGVAISQCDAASTFPAAADNAIRFDAVRIGIGLFGASGGNRVSALQCAIRVDAPVVRLQEYKSGTRVGYGGTMLAVNEQLISARCGYADGIPQTLDRIDDIVSVGMQYITARKSRYNASSSSVCVIDETTDLDALAKKTGRLPHEIVCALGNGGRTWR